MKKASWDDDERQSSATFALETSSILGKQKPQQSDSGLSLLDSAYSGQEKLNMAHVLFLRDVSTPSHLIEQTLKTKGFHVTVVRNVPELMEEWKLGIHDLVLLDHSLPLNERLALLKSSRERHRPIPMVMIFEPDTEHEAELAKESGATECIIRDGFGEYLLKIPVLIETFAEMNNLSRTRKLPSDPEELSDDTTSRIDLESLAEEVRGTAVDTQKACLVVLGGPDVGKRIELGPVLSIVGRDSSCQLSLHDESISRFHASFKQFPSGAVGIKDLDSTNGTYVEGKRIQTARLNDGDKVLLGRDTLIKFQIQDAIDSSYHEELFIHSTRDGLTGLNNRRYCLERIKANISYARRHERPVSILMFDVDHFKRVNDTYGHQTGDLVLRSVAGVINAAIRTEDVLGRYGGEEFLLFALDTELKGAKVLAERMRTRVENEVIHTKEESPRTVRVTISIGVSTAIPGDSYDLEELIQTADANLYKAKKSGRNCVVAPGETSGAVVIGRMKL